VYHSAMPMRVVSVFTLALVALIDVRPVSIQAQIAQAVPSASEFVMGPNYVLMPEKFFVLVRMGKQIGAIRFTKIERDGDNNGKSNYESYFQGDESGSLVKANVIKRSGEIEIKPMRGIHAFAWQPGQNKLWVGKWWFGCLGPSLVNMSEHFSEDDKGYEFAPTSAHSISEIDTTDTRLRWFRFNTNARVRVPVSGLAK
jgi:hypothetical protein